MMERGRRSRKQRSWGLFKEGTARLREVLVADHESRRRIRIGVIGRPGDIAPDRLILGLMIGDVNRRPLPGQFKEFGGDVLVDAQTAV